MDKRGQTLERRVQQATAKMQRHQDRHRKVVEKFITQDEKDRAEVDKAQAELAKHRAKQRK